jgi:hypothetical protein
MAQEPITRRMLLRAILKGVGLYLLLNIVYGVVNPVQTGRLPTLYNGLFPGRVRFQKFNEYDPYRMVDDHIISTASAETFNIVILGSSEMWGAGTLADNTIPAKLDRMGLVAADGRPVRVYNLAHPTPYAFRDLIILDVVLQRRIPVDLVIVSTFYSSLSLRFIWAPVIRANMPLAVNVLDRYHVSSAYVLVDGALMEPWRPFFLHMWDDRDALMIWVTSQINGFVWSMSRIDFDVEQDELALTSGLPRFIDTLQMDSIDPPPTRDFLDGFQRLSQQTGVPIIILDAPVPYDKNEFAPWLQTQTETLGLPLIDCWDLLRSPSDFEELFHIHPRLHDFYVRVLAKHLSDPSLAIPGLPLRMPADFATPAESCRVYP